MEELKPSEIYNSLMRLREEAICLHISIGSVLALKLAIDKYCYSDEIKKAIVDTEVLMNSRLKKVLVLLEQREKEAKAVIKILSSESSSANPN